MLFVRYCGGWERMNKKIKAYFPTINITRNPRDVDNSGQLSELLEILQSIYRGYITNPNLWIPVINGFVRQRDDNEGIPSHLLNHMTGGLDNVINWVTPSHPKHTIMDF